MTTSTSTDKILHLTRAERVAKGKKARTAMPIRALADFGPAADRPDPIAILEAQGASRVPDLVPIRYGRMLTSPFAFYRGAAAIMAQDLGAGQHSSLSAQLCGDAHMANFGMFASPERRLVFDANDFDETLPGPFEWDIKRLAASIEIAARGNEWKPKQRRAVVVAAAKAYREAMRKFADQSNLEVWYARLDVQQMWDEVRSRLKPERARLTEEIIAKARTRDSMQAVSKLTTMVDGAPRISSDPPLIVPVEELLPQEDAEILYHAIRQIVRSYRRTLQPDRRVLLEQFRLVQMARKVVGVGSVGTRAWILLMEGIDGGDPMFLQAKEAQASVLEPVVGASKYANHGQRVVNGQRLMQASSDIFLGWERTSGMDGVERDYYLRQLRDWKASFPAEQMLPTGMTIYGELCGWTLARAHARSGDRMAMGAYLGSKATFENAIADFAGAYADQNDRDFAALEQAVASGRLTAERGL